MAIDPDNFLDNAGNPRRRDNVAVELSEGDILIDTDGEPYAVTDGELSIYVSGARIGDGTLVLVDKTQAVIAAQQGKQIYNIEDLGLKD